MAETEFASEFETRLAALEKTVAELRKSLTGHGTKLREATAAVTEARDNSARTVAMLDEVLPLVRRAAPLLDSPMAKMAQSPAGAALARFAGGMRRG